MGRGVNSKRSCTVAHNFACSAICNFGHCATEKESHRSFTGTNGGCYCNVYETGINKKLGN